MQNMFILLDEAVKKLDSKNVSAIQADASNPADLDKAYSIIRDEKGHLDILFANAGAVERVRSIQLLSNISIIYSTLMLKACYLLFKKRYQSSVMVDQLFSIDLLLRSEVVDVKVFIVLQKRRFVHLQQSNILLQ